MKQLTAIKLVSAETHSKHLKYTAHYTLYKYTAQQQTFCL